MTDTVPEQIPLTVGEAAKALTGFEIIAIEDRFRAPLDKLSGSKMLIGLVWAHWRRAGSDRQRIAWADAEKLTLGQLEAFFEPEPDGLDEDAEGNDGSA